MWLIPSCVLKSDIKYGKLASVFRYSGWRARSLIHSHKPSSTASRLGNTRLTKWFSRISSQMCSIGFSSGARPLASHAARAIVKWRTYPRPSRIIAQSPDESPARQPLLLWQLSPDTPQEIGLPPHGSGTPSGALPCRPPRQPPAHAGCMR